jgi:hypothetical protein
MYPVQVVKSLKKTVTAAGTAEALSATTLKVSRCKIKALKSNTDLIYLGDSSVDSTTGYELNAEDEISFTDLLDNPDQNCVDLAAVFIDSAVNGEGVAVIYVD